MTSRHAVRILLAALAAALAACDGGGSAGASRGESQGGPPPPVVEVLRVEPGAIEGDAALLGQLEAEESVTVRSREPGTIETIGFEEGEPVEAGQLLFRLDDDEPRAHLRERRAALRLAEDTRRRTADLASRGVVSEARVEQVEAELESARARVEAAQVALEHTRIRAPFDGVAGRRRVSPGARVEPEDALVDVDELDTLKLVFTLPEKALPLARKGVEIGLSVAPFPGERFRGEISFVAPSLNPRNRRLLVMARVPNPDRRLRPGLFAQVEARLGQREGLVVPASAVAYGSRGSFVWRVDEQSTVEPVDVELGIRQAGRVEIRSGLRAGDVVVVAGTNKLSPGLRVETVRSPDAPADPSASVAGPDAPPGASGDAARDERPAPGAGGEVAS